MLITLCVYSNVSSPVSTFALFTCVSILTSSSPVTAYTLLTVVLAAPGIDVLNQTVYQSVSQSNTHERTNEPVVLVPVIYGLILTHSLHVYFQRLRRLGSRDGSSLAWFRSLVTVTLSS